MAKKKKPAANPARGFATTSIASKPKAEKNDDVIAPVPTGSSGKPAEKISDVAEDGSQVQQEKNAQDSKDLHELSPEEMELQLERDELQLLVDQHGAKARRDASRQVSRAQTDCRILRSQAQSLHMKNWLSSEVVQQIINLAREDALHDPQTIVQSSEDAVNEDEMIARLWALREALSGFGISAENVETVLGLVVQKRLDNGQDNYLWGFQQSLEYLARTNEEAALPPFDARKVIASQSQTPVDSENEAPPVHGKTLFPLRNVSTPRSPSVASRSAVSPEAVNTPEISDVESDLEPDQLLPVYISLRAKLFELQPEEGTSNSQKGKPKLQKGSMPASIQSPAVAKLQKQVAKIEADVLFDKREAEARWITKRNELAREAASRRRLNLPDRDSPLLGPSIDSSTASSDAEAVGEQVKQASQNSADSDDESLIGGMFLEGGDVADAAHLDSGANGATVRIRDFGKSTGMNPRRIFEEACRARDPSASVTSKLVSSTTYSSRHSLSVQWSKRQDPAISMDDVELSQSPQSMTFTMMSISAPNPQQSEAFISVAALFAIFSQSVKEEKVYMRLPPVWRDVWQEFAAVEKEKKDTSDRQTVKHLRELIQQQKMKEEEDGVVLAHRLRPKRDGDQARISPSYELNIQESEDLQRLWKNKTSSASYQRMLPVRSSLPIFGYRQEILAAIEANQVLILCGETGCGKSTQVPAYVLEHELFKGKPCKIYCTEPRRISAISLAQRVSEELGEGRNDVGTSRSLVGYAIRLESHVSAATRLVYATVGIVLRMLESNQGLTDATHLVIDEVHERSIDTDFLLIIVKAMLVKRPKLRVILMSATVDAQRFSSYMDGAPILTVPGRTYPVQTMFLEDAIEMTQLTSGDKSQLEESDEDLDATKEDIQSNKAGLIESLRGYSASTRLALNDAYDEYRIDYELIVRLIQEVSLQPSLMQFSKAFLVFLPGIAEIRELNDILRGHPAFGADWLIHPLHSTIASDEQQQAFIIPPPGVRKVVLATNIAETGITIPDITCVLDTGKHKEMRFDERRQLSRLLQAFISRSNAKQRRGRAGRVQEGLCFHLFTKYRHDYLLAENQTPEMLRLSLQDLIMRVKITKLGDIEQTLAQALDPPAPKNVRKAIEALIEVDALTSKEDLTPLGEQIAKLPLDANLGKLCLLACIFSCLDVALTIAAILSSKSPFVTPFGERARADAARLAFKRGDSDLLTAYNAYVAWRRACYNPAESEFQFCRKYFLSPQNLSGIEDLKAQLFNALIDAGCVQLSIEDRQKLSRYRYASRHRSFVPVPAAYNVNRDKDDFVSSVIAWSLYPKLLVRDGKGWRNVANNQTVSLHPTSVNKGIQSATFMSYYSILQSSSKYYNANSTSVAQDFPLAMFAGNADFRLHAGVLVVDGNRLKFSVNDWRTIMAVKLLRTRLKEIVAAKLRAPGKPLGRRLERWMEVVQAIFDARDAVERKGKTNANVMSD